MALTFSDEDILVIYGEFQKKINELIKFKNSPNHPLYISNINTDLKLYSSITTKIEEAYPQLEEMKKYL